MDPRLKQFGRRALTGLLMVALFVWLAQRNDDDGRVITRDLLGLGTLITVSLWVPPEQTDADAQAALDALAPWLQTFERRWSVLGDGALATVNARLAEGVAAALPAELQPLIRRAADIGSRSDGRFDARIGALVKLWQFQDQTDFRNAPPNETALRPALAALSAAPPLAAADVWGPAPGVQLDFGGIAKGAAAAEIAARLKAAGYPNLIVNIGGNVQAAGRKGSQPWRIGIRHPRPAADSQQMLALLPTDGDEAIITSGDYERYFIHAGTRYHHLLDPRSGQPARGLQSVTVVTDDPVLGDAASTALFVAGTDWPSVATALELDQVLVVRDDGRLQATARLAERLLLPDGLTLERLP
ncbi:FAD:protein FMN transferase [Flagellatimonas centrodinii]|uniref:FAD:protein FMN transferase n=1 Tax=Flagellatimonas centrodinii TaxID=2806210 RepID=UPI001FEF9C2C|nr:FAD:protein FMN transferase [Flagellatimonas centrodinii]ULQ46841.1 FAD:protein FMN transferase [Flagellatimonas centrodinii]